MQLVYMGFEQAANIRQYIFHRVAYGEETKVLVVTTDLELFQRNHVGLQEGPAVCLRVLRTELEATEAPQHVNLRRVLTDQHMQAYLISRSSPGAKSSTSLRGRPPRG